MANNLTGPSGENRMITAGEPVPNLWTQQADDAPPAASAGMKIGQYLSMIWRRKWLILVFTALGGVAGYAGARFVTQVYTAYATIWIQTPPRGGEGRGPIRSEELLHAQAWVDLLRSQAVLENVARQHRLYVGAPLRADFESLEGFTVGETVRPGAYQLVTNPTGNEWTLRTSEGEILERGQPGDSVGERLGFKWIPAGNALMPNRRIGFHVSNPNDVARALDGMLQTTMAREGNFIHLQMRGRSAVWVASTLDAITKRYVELAGELKRAKLTEVSSILANQLAYAQRNLADAEIALENFRVKTITSPAEVLVPSAGEGRSDPTYLSYFNMRIEQQQLRRDREAIEQALTDGRTGELSIDALQMIPSVTRSPELTQALQYLTTKRADLRVQRNQFTDEHAVVKATVRETQELAQVTIPRLAGVVLANMADQEQRLEAQIGSASGELQQIPPRMIEQARLQRQVSSAEVLQAGLQQRYEEARLTTLTSVPDVQILDAPRVPQAPESDSSKQILYLGVMAGFGFAILLAFVLDRFDTRLRYPEQVTNELRLPILGAVPSVPARPGRHTAEKGAQLIEAFRTLRLNILQSFDAKTPLVFTVTSPGSGDGKSFVSSRLAIAFANLGLKTLLIDGDIRRGTLHQLFNITRTPGLTDFLAGTAAPDSIIVPTSEDRLDLMPSGTRIQKGPELLGGVAMQRLMNDVRSRYQVVIVDTPPMGAGGDPFIFGTLTGAMVVILRAGTTDKLMSEAHLASLERFPVRLLGGILNDVSSVGSYKYYSYLTGYDVEQDTDDSSQPAMPAST
jgi:succinoglycan biosynthesis transport protein ExoP